MTSITKKVKTLVLSNIHALLDKMIDLNSIEALKQYIRDLEDGIDKVGLSIAEASGTNVSTKRELEGKQVRADQLNKAIDRLLTDDNVENDTTATILEKELLQEIEPAIKLLKEQYEIGQKTESALGQSLVQLQAKHREMMSNLAKLEILDKSTKAKEQAALAIESAKKIAGDTTDLSVDNITAKIQKRSDIADSRLSMALKGIENNNNDEIINTELADRIKERKARLNIAN